jgi:hypothetical protein
MPSFLFPPRIRREECVSQAVGEVVEGCIPIMVIFSDYVWRSPIWDIVVFDA